MKKVVDDSQPPPPGETLMVARKDVDAIEIELLLEGIRRRWGYDFTHYSYASIKRRLEHAKRESGFERFTQLLDQLLHDERAFDRFLRYMSVTVTEMFRDPPFYKSVREKLIPVLKTYPFVKIWCAGCATGEEVYSMAILLHEEDYLGRARIYATDFNKHSLDIAEKGVYPARHLETYAANYRAAGGQRDFADYYSSGYDFAKMKELPTDDPVFGKGSVRADGRKIHPVYLFEVKKPSESKGPWDYYKVRATIPAEQAFRPIDQGNCPLVKK